MRVVLVSPSDNHCYGARHIMSFLRERGHEVWLLILKHYTSKRVGPEELAALRHPPPGSFSPVTETVEEGTFVCSYVCPMTETERRLFLDFLAQIRPDLIGMSLTTTTAPVGQEITADIKREFPKVPVIWGGVHPTILPEEALQWTDMICIGEGEHAMAEIADDPERTDVQGVWRRTNTTVIRNPIRPLEQNLDVFPLSAWGENDFLIEDNQLIPLPASNRPYFANTYLIMTQRGCPFSCSYCCNHVRRSQHKGERYIRRRSVDHVLAECAQRRRDFDLPSIVFWDDIFVQNREWIEEFADKYPQRVGLPFGGYAHAQVSDEAMIRLLAQAGMTFLGLGIQSGSEYVSHQVYNRPQSAKRIIEVAQWGEKYGLELSYDLLSNCEYEREADCLDTLRLMVRMPKARQIRVKGLAVFPSTRIASLDLPKHCLPESTFEFWNTLYVMTRHREISGEHLLELAKDEYLKAHPETLRAIALAFKQMEETIRANRSELERLTAQQSEASVRGLLRYAKRLVGRHLPRPMANGIKSILARLRAAEAQR